MTGAAGVTLGGGGGKVVEPVLRAGVGGGCVELFGRATDVPPVSLDRAATGTADGATTDVGCVVDDVCVVAGAGDASGAPGVAAGVRGGMLIPGGGAPRDPARRGGSGGKRRPQA